MPNVPYTVTAENCVIGPDGIVMYNEGDETMARRVADFLNYEYDEALEGSLDRNDRPLSGSEWEALKRKTAIKGEESS